MSIVAQANPADEVVPGIYLGSRYAALNENWLRQHKIQATFNCTKDIPFDPAVKRQFRVPVDDSLQEPDIRNLEHWSYELVYIIAAEHRKAQQNGGAVLIHCAAGMQRSAASVAMYLIATRGMTTDQAVAYIRSKREIAFKPSINFEKSIRGFEAAFNNEVRPALGGIGQI
jgi:hypothetical protein